MNFQTYLAKHYSWRHGHLSTTPASSVPHEHHVPLLFRKPLLAHRISFLAQLAVTVRVS
jgi:hypothetical protein